MTSNPMTALGLFTASLTDATVRAATQTVASSLVREAAHPSGIAAALGREGMDHGDPDGLARLHERLMGIGVDQMTVYLDRVTSLVPLRSELQP